MATGKVAASSGRDGMRAYYHAKVDELEVTINERTQDLRRLEAQRNELNTKGVPACRLSMRGRPLTRARAVRLLREELMLLQEPGSYVGEVVKVMGKAKALVKVQPEGKYVVDIDKSINIADLTPTTRVALRNDSYTLHKVRLLPCSLAFGWGRGGNLAPTRAPSSRRSCPTRSTRL